MTDPYNTCIEHRRRVYRYDPDYDCFYPVDHYKDMTPLEALSPIVVMLVLSAICVYLEYFR